MTRPPRRSASTNPPPQVGRFAHPFFSSSPPADRPAVNGRQRMTDWSKSQLGPVSPPRNGGRLALADIIGASGVQEIEGIGELRFHALGDSGVGHADDAEHVADVIAIPGNHDGEAKSPADEPSLSAFLANFCTEKPVVPTQASGSGIFRETMTLPGPYWMLDGPFARIIGLYSNRLENPGFLEGDGGNDTSQLKWLQDILTAIKRTPEKALIMATHHPPFSSAGHSGSTEMLQSIDEICSKAGLLPDLLLSAHAHNYQFYTRRIGGHQVPFIVAGTGGMPPQTVPPATGEPFGATKDTTYDSGVGALGYLFVTVSAHQIKTEFWPLQHAQQVAFDTRIVDLKTHTVTRG
jgi:Calcineurin-like phosphoesterase